MELTVIVFELVVDPITAVHISIVQRQPLQHRQNEPVDVSGILSGE
jgi:hypothetical protein